MWPNHLLGEPPTLSTLDASNGVPVNLEIAKQKVRIAGRNTTATAINGSVPGPLVRLKEGTDAVLRVTNRLSEDSSIHWHGIILPFQMDGVPGLSYDGIKPGETFEYRFPVRQNGTYWYHSHSGLQEQTGVYGPLVIDPAQPDPFSYDREHVIVLSDWTFENPHRVMARLKKQSDYFNYQQQTLLDLARRAKEDGFVPTAKDRLMWSKMRMMPTDIADVTGHAYTYLMNGLAPETNWTGLFNPGETVRLRFINASAMSYFDVRLPGLEMTVVQADGQNIQPVPVDEFRISVAETYDVLVRPTASEAYTIFAESMDRSGYARGTLAPAANMTAEIPPRRQRPLLTMRDMGMDHSKMSGMEGMDHSKMSGMEGMDHSKMSGMEAMDHSKMSGMEGMDHSKMAGMEGMDHSKMAGMEAMPQSPSTFMHGPDHHGPGNSSGAMVAQRRLHEPGIGLEDSPRRVLVYTDLKALTPWHDLRKPGREIELHLTGNMERYMWSFNGEQFSSRTEPIRLVYGERVRLTFVNDTMMNHPIHLHGMWMVLDNGSGRENPLKHTINVKPAERLSADVSVDAPGNWAFHCHLLFHMDMGMFRVVSVSKPLGKRTGS